MTAAEAAAALRAMICAPEFHTPADLADALTVLEIVAGIPSSVGVEK